MDIPKPNINVINGVQIVSNGIEHDEQQIAKSTKQVDVEWFSKTIVAKTLLSSKQFTRKFKGRIEDVWWDPKEFLNKLSQYIWDKTRAYDMDHWILIFGYEGSGKSSISIMLYNAVMKERNKELKLNLDPSKTIKTDLVFMQSEYAKTLYNYTKNRLLGKQHPIIIDDAHYVFGKYYGLTAETQSLLQIARFARSQQVIHILNTQVPQQLFADIWRERVNTYLYCFSVDIMNPKTERIVSRHLYTAFYNMETSQILRQDPLIRMPLFWQKILKKYPPDMITRFDVLFEDTTHLYNAYKYVKDFYAKFYQYLRYKGITKGKYFERVFEIMKDIAKAFEEYGEMTTRLLEDVLYSHIEMMPPQVLKKFEEYGILYERNGRMVFDDELLNMALDYSDIIIKRSRIFATDEIPDDMKSNEDYEND